jgi:6,7-dimethyl-8-ribityllumazine synthase
MMTPPKTAIRRDADGTLRIGIIQSRFNDRITDELRLGAMRQLNALGVTDDRVTIVSVPGAVEIPIAAQALACRGRHEAIIALGAVIRGDTTHYDYVCSMVADGCLRVSLDFDVPVVFGVLTCENEEQALARIQPGTCHKGEEAAQVAVEMSCLLKDLKS